MRKISWYYKFLIFKLKKKTNLDNFVFKKNQSLDQIFNYFGTDKGTQVKDPYSKVKKKNLGHGFGKFYEKHLKKFKKRKFNFLEIGTWEGASLASFYCYFRNANIHGIDRNFKNKYESKRIKFNYCDTTNFSDLRIFKKKFEKKKFKIIIDDGSHLLSNILQNLNFFFRFLEKGGFYIIEDFNHPKYFHYLNDIKGKELYVNEVIDNFRKKKLFESEILQKNDQKFFWDKIQEIHVYKGNALKSKRNISDILFLKKND